LGGAGLNFGLFSMMNDLLSQYVEKVSEKFSLIFSTFARLLSE
jgi:hypothetical protein